MANVMITPEEMAESLKEAIEGVCKEDGVDPIEFMRAVIDDWNSNLPVKSKEQTHNVPCTEASCPICEIFNKE